jgi:hypothetical protein
VYLIAVQRRFDHFRTIRSKYLIRTPGRRLCQLIFFLPLYSLFPTLIQAGELPERVVADYTVYKGIVTLAKTRRTLKKLGDNQYEFYSVTKPSGVGKILTSGEIREKSLWEFNNNTTRPTEYTYVNSGSKKKREVKLVFNWDDGKVTNIINGDPWEMDLIPAMQDKLLYQLTLMLDLSKGKRHLEYAIADGGTLKTYKAVIMGTEEITVEMGKFEALKIVRQHDDGSVTSFWCAPKLMYLPIKIQQIKKDGGTASAELYALAGLSTSSSQNK